VITVGRAAVAIAKRRRLERHQLLHDHGGCCGLRTAMDAFL
jgi:hypothetical protein